MPDIILHYLADHGFQPDQNFVDDVMNSVLLNGRRCHHFETLPIHRVGYLYLPFESGEVNEKLVLKLQRLIHQIDEDSKTAKKEIAI